MLQKFTYVQLLERRSMLERFIEWHYDLLYSNRDTISFGARMNIINCLDEKLSEIIFQINEREAEHLQLTSTETVLRMIGFNTQLINHTTYIIF